MGVLEEFDEYFSTGDPVMREWAFVKSKSLPFILCGLYLWIVLSLGPSMMKDRKPFRLREIMIVYNCFVAVTYLIGVSQTSYYLYHLGFNSFCKNMEDFEPNVSYIMRKWGWVAYVLKYVEFLDTFFFILRKRFDLVTNLHVIHHSILPIFSWTFARTEKSVLQGIPVIINSSIHVIMYTYYGLAAVGPSMQKYLWWKKYLTIAQMIQFFLIFSVVAVIMPLTGCTTTNITAVINVTIFLLFFPLFLNFYIRTFKIKKVNSTTKRQSHENGGSETSTEQSKIKSS